MDGEQHACHESSPIAMISMRFFALLSVLALVPVAALPGLAVAQFNAPDSTETGAPADDAEGDAPAKPDELVRQLESNARRGGIRLPRAIASLARLGAWEQVDRWLATLDKVDDPQVLAEAAEAIGPQLLLRISLYEELSEAGRSAIKKLTDASNSVKQTPARLQQAIDQLAGSDVDQNLAANRILMDGGHATVKAIVETLIDGTTGQQRSKLLAVLDALGDGGSQSLQQLALYGVATTRGPALDALAMLDDNAAIDGLLTAHFAADASAEERQVAAKRLPLPNRYDAADAIATLTQRLQELRQIARDTANDAQPTDLWSVNQDRTGVTVQRSSHIFRQYRRAYDQAQRIRRIPGLPDDVLGRVVAADLGYRVMVDVQWGSGEEIQSLRDSYGDLLGIDLLLDAVRRERDAADVPAVVGLLRLLENLPHNRDQARRLLVPRGNGFSELVDAVGDPAPRIRYEAASLIAKLLQSHEIQATFPGASYYQKTLAEMASLHRDPTAILVETRPVIALRQETILTQLGYRVVAVKNGLQAERVVHQGGDLRLVVSKVEPADMTAAELVDRIRRQGKGSRVPIVFYSDTEAHERSVTNVEYETTTGRWDSVNTPSVYLVPLPGAPAALSEVLEEVSGKLRLPSLTVSELEQFRTTGQETLEGELAPR